MITKRILDPQHLRRIPEKFSWLDHRLVRDNHLQDCQPNSLALYLFLVTVGDYQGLSYYSDRAIGRQLGLDTLQLSKARRQLSQAKLIAYAKPLYQVLDLAPQLESHRSKKTVSLKELFEKVMQNDQDQGVKHD
jgi:hypothetical protein